MSLLKQSYSCFGNKLILVYHLEGPLQQQLFCGKLQLQPGPLKSTPKKHASCSEKIYWTVTLKVHASLYHSTCLMQKKNRTVHSFHSISRIMWTGQLHSSAGWEVLIKRVTFSIIASYSLNWFESMSLNPPVFIVVESTIAMLCLLDIIWSIVLFIHNIIFPQGDAAVGDGVNRHVLSMAMQKLKTGFRINLGLYIWVCVCHLCFHVKTFVAYSLDTVIKWGNGIDL